MAIMTVTMTAITMMTIEGRTVRQDGSDHVSDSHLSLPPPLLRNSLPLAKIELPDFKSIPDPNGPRHGELKQIDSDVRVSRQYHLH